MQKDEPLESSIRNCIEINAAMQLTLSKENWCGNWGDNNECPYRDNNRIYQGLGDFKGCDYKRIISKNQSL